ncbi:MAG TPA: HutD family protein [Dokdonella sp.]|nr:HutD family protein [Dokdonella sp.]
MTLQRIPPSTYRRTRWKNDGGWTTEIARSGDDDFRWRISIAEIERDGPFSSFPGVERDLLLLEGNGIELDIDDAPPRRLTQRFERVHFAGEARVDCRLIAGPTRDFNVMARRDTVHADVIARPLVGSMVIFPERAAEWFVHVFAGNATVRSDADTLALETGTSLLADFRDGGGRLVLEGGGELVLVKLVSSES